MFQEQVAEVLFSVALSPPIDAPTDQELRSEQFTNV